MNDLTSSFLEDIQFSTHYDSGWVRVCFFWVGKTHRLHRLDIARRSRPLIMKKDTARWVASQISFVRIKTYHPGNTIWNNFEWNLLDICFGPCPKHWKLAVDTVFCLRLGSFHLELIIASPLWTRVLATPQLMRIMEKTGMELPKVFAYHLLLFLLHRTPRCDRMSWWKHRPNLQPIRVMTLDPTVCWEPPIKWNKQDGHIDNLVKLKVLLLLLLVAAVLYWPVCYSQVYCIKPSNIPIQYCQWTTDLPRLFMSPSNAAACHWSWDWRFSFVWGAKTHWNQRGVVEFHDNW